MKSLTAFVLAGTLLFAMPVLAQDATSSSANTNMDILIQKIKADKKLLVATNMELSDAEGKKFWPLYDAYQKELGKLNLRLGKVIQEYADAYNKGSVPNDTAKKLLKETLAIDESELKLRKTSADKIGKVISATKTARYIQIENKIRTVLRMELAENIPLVY